VFVGKAFRTVDEKGRLVLPANFRRDFESTSDRKVIVAPAEDKCLMVMRPHDFLVVAESRRTDMQTMTGRANYRYFVSNAAELELDKAGRLSLGEEFRSFAGIAAGAEAVVAGMVNFVEIWNKERFLAREAGADASFLFPEVLGEVSPA
jgi:MraZ protein